MAPDFGARSVLLLQGPMGPFFRRFADDLERAGARVTKVHFNGGDRLLYGNRGSVDFRGSLDELPAFLRALVEERGIDAAFLFGDARPVHRKARATLEALGVPIYVFEEGYLRPEFITLERGGVNGNSPLPRDPEFYRAYRPARPPEPARHVGATFWYTALYATLYVIAMALGRARYPSYVHHRELRPAREAFAWVRAGVRKLLYRFRERRVLPALTGALSGRYFLVALQVHCDSQLGHSRYRSVEHFLTDVVEGFAAHAEPDVRLVVKHHPLDRAYREYGALIASLAERHGLGERLVYVHDLPLPTLLQHARGVITINSTAGLQSIHHGTPVKTLGHAIYDLPGLTHQGPFSEFLRAPGEVDAALYRAFRRYLLAANQANGSFARRLPGVWRGAGVRWFPEPPLGR